MSSEQTTASPAAKNTTTKSRQRVHAHPYITSVHLYEVGSSDRDGEGSMDEVEDWDKEGAVS